MLLPFSFVNLLAYRLLPNSEIVEGKDHFRGLFFSPITLGGFNTLHFILFTVRSMIKKYSRFYIVHCGLWERCLYDCLTWVVLLPELKCVLLGL